MLLMEFDFTDKMEVMKPEYELYIIKEKIKLARRTAFPARVLGVQGEPKQQS